VLSSWTIKPIIQDTRNYEPKKKYVYKIKFESRLLSFGSIYSNICCNPRHNADSVPVYESQQPFVRTTQLFRQGHGAHWFKQNDRYLNTHCSTSSGVPSLNYILCVAIGHTKYLHFRIFTFLTTC
jgi:hypothetical protein